MFRAPITVSCAPRSGEVLSPRDPAAAPKLELPEHLQQKVTDAFCEDLFKACPDLKRLSKKQWKEFQPEIGELYRAWCEHLWASRENVALLRQILRCCLKDRIAVTPDFEDKSVASRASCGLHECGGPELDRRVIAMALSPPRAERNCSNAGWRTVARRATRPRPGGGRARSYCGGAAGGGGGAAGTQTHCHG
jgi:hypothetical protein